MNREIKFRIWDKKNAKFISKWERVFINAWECCVYTKSELEKSDFNYNNDLSEIEVNQFTGLKDRKGVEIYEGDIVEFWVDGYAKSRTAKVKFNTERGRWMLFATIGHHRDLTAEKASKCEVIGNICENSELLK